MAIWINVTHFPSYSNWLLAKEYVFPQKNSAAQIWCSSVFLAISFIKPKSFFQKLLLYMGCGYIILIVFMSQCRTAILALGVVTILSVLRKSKRKMLWILLLIGVFIALISIPVVRELLNQAWEKLKESGFLFFRKASSESKELLDFIDEEHGKEMELFV